MLSIVIPGLLVGSSTGFFRFCTREHSHKTGHRLIILRVYLKRITGCQKTEEKKPKIPSLSTNKKRRLYLKITVNDSEVDSHSCSECWENCLSHDDKVRCLDSMLKRFNVAA